MWQQTSFKCFLKLGKLSRCVSNTTCRHQWDSGVSYSSISQCGTVRRLVRSDVISYWRLFHVICSSPQWIPLTEHGQRRKLFFFRIVMKLPSTDVTFLLCSKLSVYFLTYLLSRPAAMHCSTHKATMFYTLSFDDANLSSDAVLQLGYFRKEHESVANASRLSVATAQLSVNTELIYIRWWSQLRL